MSATQLRLGMHHSLHLFTREKLRFDTFWTTGYITNWITKSIKSLFLLSACLHGWSFIPENGGNKVFRNYSKYLLRLPDDSSPKTVPLIATTVKNSSLNWKPFRSACYVNS
jgi:hypothetical protein